MLGSFYEDMFIDVGINAEMVTTEEQNIKKLYLDRIDTFIMNELVGWSIIKKSIS